MTFDPKVVPFDRSAAYVHHRAMKNRRDNNPVDALELLRRAVENAPENVEYKLDLAEMYCEMGCHAQSNRLLLDLLAQENAPSECYYGLALNMLAMNDLEGAKRTLMRYRRSDPKGARSLDAGGLAEELTFYTAMLRPASRKAYRAARIADQACDRMKREDFGEARRLFEKSLALDPARREMRALYALDLKLAGEEASAIEQAQRATEGEEPSLRALCVAAQVYQMAGRADLARREILRAVALRPEGLELRLLMYALGEMGMHQEVAECARMALREAPHDRKLLHTRAVALHYTGAPDAEVIKFWERILRIDPEDSIAAYFQSMATRGQLNEIRLNYIYQVPKDEMLRRFKSIADTLSSSMEELEQVWQSDANFRALLKWCATVESPQFRRAAVTVLSTLEDPEAESTLREILLRPDIPFDLKLHASMLLRMRGADMQRMLPPSVDEEDGMLPESDQVLEGLPLTMRQAAKYADRVLEEVWGVSALPALAVMFLRVWNACPSLPRSRERVEVLAAASAYCYLKLHEYKVRFDKIAREFGCSFRRVVYYAARMADALEEEENEGN